MDWKKLLKINQIKTVYEQQINKEEIIEAFREMWKSNPSEKVFSEYTMGILICPEMIYLMVKSN